MIKLERGQKEKDFQSREDTCDTKTARGLSHIWKGMGGGGRHIEKGIREVREEYQQKQTRFEMLQ